jgi:hypothetical protein
LSAGFAAHLTQYRQPEGRELIREEGLLAEIASGVGSPEGVEDALMCSQSSLRSPRMFDKEHTSAVDGEVHWSPAKSGWITTMTITAMIGGPIFFSWDALALFVVTTAATVCLGHSLGMHRRLIHRSYDCPRWLERLFVYIGTLAGMAGPYGMIRQHDIRDWAQRKPRCHPYLAHRSPLLRDGYWQLHCELRLAHPPALVIEPAVRDDRFYQFFFGKNLDGAAITVRDYLLCRWGNNLGDLGCCRESYRLRHGSLARWLFRPQSRSTILAYRGRRRAGLQRALLRVHHNGRGLAQQSSCISRLGAAWTEGWRVGPRLVGA